MLEKTIEAAHVAHVKKAGGLSLKFTSPQRRSVPDRLDLLGVDKAAETLRRELSKIDIDIASSTALAIAKMTVAGAIQFTELKAPGKTPTEAQEREHQRLRALGFQVNVKDFKEKA